MPDLPARPDFEQLRRQAEELLRSAESGDARARGRVARVSDDLKPATARLALAREYGFASWARLEREVERRALLNARDVAGLQRMLAEEPSLATAQMEHWCDHRLGVAPLN